MQRDRDGIEIEVVAHLLGVLIRYHDEVAVVEPRYAACGEYPDDFEAVCTRRGQQFDMLSNLDRSFVGISLGDQRVARTLDEITLRQHVRSYDAIELGIDAEDRQRFRVPGQHADGLHQRRGQLDARRLACGQQSAPLKPFDGAGDFDRRVAHQIRAGLVEGARDRGGQRRCEDKRCDTDGDAQQCQQRAELVPSEVAQSDECDEVAGSKQADHLAKNKRLATEVTEITERFMRLRDLCVLCG